MHSSQVNFFATKSDLRLIESVLRRLDPYLVIPCASKSAHCEDLRDLAPADNGADLVVYLVRSMDSESVAYKYYDTLDQYKVDCMRSPVIELTRCYEDDRSLRIGRMYYIKGYFASSGEWIDKSDAFLKWAERVITLVRRKMKRDSKLKSYLGEEAARRWREENWTLS